MAKRSASSVFTSRLKKLGSLWKKGKSEAANMGEFAAVDDGTYIARLVDAELRESDAGNFGLRSVFVILRGDEKGTQVTRWDGLEREQGMPFVVRYLRSIGIDTDDLEIENLEEALKEVIAEKPAFRIRLKTKPDSDFQNLYIQKPLGQLEDEDEDEDGSEGASAGNDAEEEKGEGSEDESALEVGATVSLTVGKKKKIGVVKSIAPGGGEESVLVKFEDGSKGNFDPDDLEVVEAEEEASDSDDDSKGETGSEEPAIGDSVSWGKGKTGIVIKIKGDTLHVREKGKRTTVEVEKDEAEVLVD